jgi:hypothetical protein
MKGILAVLVTVAVMEGQVLFTNSYGEQVVNAEQTATAETGSKPALPTQAPEKKPTPPTQPVKIDLGTYVIATNIKQSDGYYEAVKILADYRQAKVVLFNVDKLDSLKNDLAKLNPRYVALLLKPTDIDINFQNRFLKMCTEIDDDPFCDFSYGYITGGTDAEAVGFVKNIIKAEKEKLPHKILGVQPDSSMSRYESNAIRSYFVDWPLISLMFGKITDKPLKGLRKMTEEEISNYIDKNTSDFENNTVIFMNGHGNPSGAPGGLSVKNMKKLNLFPAVFYDWPCYNGCVSRTFTWLTEEDINERKKRGRQLYNLKEKPIVPSDSMALSVIKAGVTASIAALESYPAGVTAEEPKFAFSGESLGEARKRQYNVLIMAFISRGEKGLVTRIYKDGDPSYSDKEKGDSLRLMMTTAIGVILYGDPAFKICAKAQPFISNSLLKDKDKIILDCTTNIDSRTDSFQWCKSDKNKIARVLYTIIDLKKEVKSINRIEVIEITDSNGKKIDFEELNWIVEKTEEGKKLHIRVTFSVDLPKDSKAKFYIYTDKK